MSTLTGILAPTTVVNMTPAVDSNTSATGPLTQGSKRPLIDINFTENGRAKKGKLDPRLAALHRHGKHFARTVEGFTLMAVIINEGIARDNASKGPDTEASFDPECNRNWLAYQRLNDMIPDVVEDLFYGNADAKEIATALQDGMASARSDDTSSLKEAVVTWLRKDIAMSGKDLNPKRKPGRGFNHPVMGALLCPAALDYGDPGVQQALKEHTAVIDGSPIDGTHWPTFVYAGTYNPDLPWVGMLRGSLLVRTFIHIFLGPSLANYDDGEHAVDENIMPESPNRSTRCGNAEMNGMTAVTPHSIAYCACQFMFAICSATVFNKFSKDHHCIGFYRSVCAFFADPEFHEEAEELLRWWNRRIFPENHSATQHTGNHHLEKLKRAKAASVGLAAAAPSTLVPPSVMAVGAVVNQAAATARSPSTSAQDMAHLNRLSIAAAEARAALAEAEAAKAAAEARAAQAVGGQ
ncbi:hypothetical protein BKA93DRAFT_789928 [Sparassis latifolia]